MKYFTPKLITLSPLKSDLYMKVNIPRQKIVVTGPESSGKTTLTKQLAASLATPWIPEYARTYLDKLDRPYKLEDILLIGERQLAQHTTLSEHDPSYLLCDTSFLVLHIWVQVKYKQTNAWLKRQFIEDPVDLYLLCEPDIPWTYDPLRENPDDRYVLFELYRAALIKYQKPFVLIKGKDPTQRLKTAVTAVKELS